MPHLEAIHGSPHYGPPVYRDVYRFILKVFEYASDLSRKYKRTLGPIPLGMCVRGVRGPSGAVTRRFPRSRATWESGRGRIRDVSTGASVRADLLG